MFKKPFKIKSSNTIRGSERRKLRENVSKTYPSFTQEQIAELIPNKEEMNVMKLFTHNETVVTCYTLGKNPIFFEVEGLLLPTVYLLWSQCGSILSFVTHSNVFAKLAGGADLMFPGVIPPAQGFPEFSSQAPCVITLLGNSAAVAVGATLCSSCELATEGLQGKRVKIYHFYQDYLWAQGEKTELPMLPKCIVTPDNDPEEALSEQNVVTAENGNGTPDKDSSNDCIDTNDHSTKQQEEEVPKSPQEEMNELLQNCFFQALLDAKKEALPILVSKFSSQFLHPACPDGQRIDVKKSSYKKMSKFLSEMQCKGMIEVKELTQGVESVTKINFNHEMLYQYKKSDFSRLRKELKELQLTEQQEAKKKDSVYVDIKEVYAVSAKTAAFFQLYQLKKGSILSSTDVRKLVTDYVKEKEMADPSDKRMVVLDALLTDILFGKGNHVEKLAWDAIITRMTGNMNLCHAITLPGQEPIVKKGKMNLIEVSTEQRMGNKKVTIVKNLEAFGVDVKTFAQDLQQHAASSTTVNPVPGKNSTGDLVLVQGVQLKHVKTLLEKHKIPTKYIQGLDPKDKKKR